MSEAEIDSLARRIAAAAMDRRRLVRAAAASLATIGGGRSVDIGAKPGKNKRKRCKKKGQKCKREAAAYCARWWPAQFETCQYDHNQCCSLRGKCLTADAKRCTSHLFWQGGERERA